MLIKRITFTSIKNIVITIKVVISGPVNLGLIEYACNLVTTKKLVITTANINKK